MYVISGLIRTQKLPLSCDAAGTAAKAIIIGLQLHNCKMASCEVSPAECNEVILKSGFMYKQGWLGDWVSFVANQVLINKPSLLNRSIYK